MRVLVVNAGSSSLKLSVLTSDDTVDARCELDRWDGDTRDDRVLTFLREVGGVGAVGHRIVHGGTRFTGPVAVDDGVERDIRALTDLAPLHQPRSLAALRAVSNALPGVAAVACFDTAFHAT